MARTRQFTSTLRQYRGTKGRLKTRVARSGFEAKVMDHLDFRHVGYTYEGEKIPYVSKHHYYPDLKLDNGVIVEIKGFFPSEDRRKMRLVKEQHPELDIRLLFQSDSKLYKGAKSRYSQWATKHGFPWALKEIPSDWTD